MGSFLAGLVVAIGLAVAAAFMLDQQQVTKAESSARESVRLGDPGSNLVGPNWDGRAG